MQVRDAVDERERDHFADGDDAEAGAAAGEEARRRQARGVRQLFERAIASRGGRGGGGPDAIERRRQPRAVHRLQQVVERRQFERIDRVLIVGGAEDHRRPRLAQRRGDIEAARAGHLNVEQHQIRRQLGDPLGRLHAVVGLADDLHIGMRGEQLPQPLTRRLFIVHEQGANHVKPMP